MTGFDPSQELLTREEAARLLKVHVATIDRARKAGALEAEGGTGFVRIRREALDRWLKERGLAQNNRDSD